MKIAVLNEVFLSPDQLNRLKSLGEVEVFTDTDSEEKALSRIVDAEVIIADPFVTPLNTRVLESANKLKLIVISVVGYSKVDMETANKKGIKVANIPGFSTQAVAELTFGLILSVARSITLADRRMRENPFEVDAGNPNHSVFNGLELRGKTLGVIGLGRIGRRVAEIGHALGMNVVGYNRTSVQVPNVETLSLDELLKRSDVISLHVAFFPELENMISRPQLALMKQGVMLINTCRGKLIDEVALSEALSSGKLRGAGLDELATWEKSNPLLKLDNIVMTPHEGYLTDGSTKSMSEMVVANVEAYLSGTPINIVNP